VLTELLVEGHQWWRIARADWRDPLDPRFAQRSGGRWNPPNSFPTLYLNEDLTTARANMKLFMAAWPYEPEDLRPDTAPVLVGAWLPRHQEVADAHSRAGVTALGLPAAYPLDNHGAVVSHDVCQPVGVRVHEADLRGIRSRAARLPRGAGRELAWFPATKRSRAKLGELKPFRDWYWR
jgi:RES domain-containing protein